ncbi:hypothetical protein HK105_203697 [Polyrhizophydium stewartii]|uniref:HTH OST-type domain-containing protein n=1 Tax=Polyrhizophydium stewartii TaxID=2732419 RepID=A0ABR4NBK4_9FUNG
MAATPPPVAEPPAERLLASRPPSRPPSRPASASARVAASVPTPVPVPTPLPTHIPIQPHIVTATATRRITSISPNLRVTRSPSPVLIGVDAELPAPPPGPASGPAALPHTAAISGHDARGAAERKVSFKVPASSHGTEAADKRSSSPGSPSPPSSPTHQPQHAQMAAKAPALAAARRAIVAAGAHHGGSSLGPFGAAAASAVAAGADGELRELAGVQAAVVDRRSLGRGSGAGGDASHGGKRGAGRGVGYTVQSDKIPLEKIMSEFESVPENPSLLMRKGVDRITPQPPPSHTTSRPSSARSASRPSSARSASSRTASRPGSAAAGGRPGSGGIRAHAPGEDASTAGSSGFNRDYPQPLDHHHLVRQSQREAHDVHDVHDDPALDLASDDHPGLHAAPHAHGIDDDSSSSANQSFAHLAAMTTAAESHKLIGEARSTGAASSGSDPSLVHPLKPLTYIPPSLIKMQTVRTNLDRFRIEQIALRRLRYVIEHNEAEHDHLAVVQLLEQSYIPESLIQRYFGPSFTTIHSLRVLLLQSIDATRRLRIRTGATRITTSRIVPDERQMLKDLQDGSGVHVHVPHITPNMPAPGSPPRERRIRGLPRTAQRSPLQNEQSQQPIPASPPSRTRLAGGSDPQVAVGPQPHAARVTASASTIGTTSHIAAATSLPAHHRHEATAHMPPNEHGQLLDGEEAVGVPIGRMPLRMYTPRKEVKTPQAILSILESVDRARDNEGVRGASGKTMLGARNTAITASLLGRTLGIGAGKSASKSNIAGGRSAGDGARGSGMLLSDREFIIPNASSVSRAAAQQRAKAASKTKKTKGGAHIADPPLVPGEDIGATSVVPQSMYAELGSSAALNSNERLLGAENILRMFESKKRAGYVI